MVNHCKHDKKTKNRGGGNILKVTQISNRAPLCHKLFEKSFQTEFSWNFLLWLTIDDKGFGHAFNFVLSSVNFNPIDCFVVIKNVLENLVGNRPAPDSNKKNGFNF